MSEIGLQILDLHNRYNFKLEELELSLDLLGKEKTIIDPETQEVTQESISTAWFGTSMSARRILGLEQVPRVGLFAH